MSCLSNNICDSSERRCIRALQYYPSSSHTSMVKSHIEEENTMKWALLTDNDKVVTSVRATMVPTKRDAKMKNKLITLNNEVRVHSGLLQGRSTLSTQTRMYF